MSGQCVMRRLALGLLLALPSLSWAAAEPNTQVPTGSHHYAATPVPDRIVASPAADPSHGFAVAWRTDGSVQAPLLEIALAGDSPAIDGIRQVRATTARCRPRTVCRIITAPTSAVCSRAPCMSTACRAWQLECVEPAAHAGRGRPAADPAVLR